MSTESLVAVLAAATALLSVLLTYFSGARKRDVEALQKRAERCDVELSATKEMFAKEQARLSDRVDELLITLVKKTDK